MYDKKKGILYKRIRNTDGIGEAFFCFPCSTRKNSIKVSFHRLCMFKYRKNSKISTWYRVYILKTETLNFISERTVKVVFSLNGKKH